MSPVAAEASAAAAGAGWPRIVKDPARLGVPPNLDDYRRVRACFSWEEIGRRRHRPPWEDGPAGCRPRERETATWRGGVATTPAGFVARADREEPGAEATSVPARRGGGGDAMRRATHLLVLLLFLGLVLFLLGCAGAVYAPGPPPARGPGPDASVEVSFFYGELAPYGEWVLLDPYGWVWTPWGTPSGWRPYTVGRWVYTAHGWTWVSEWPWGWAPFHYGRWTWHPRWGWAWIPGRVWAPAWVAWRHGPGWVGWAPLPPGVEWREGVGLWLGSVDLDLAIGSHWWVFVAERDFLEPRPLRRAVPAVRNPELLRQTRDVTRFEEVGGRVAVRSVPVEEVERSVGQAVPRREVEDLTAPPPRTAEPVEPETSRVRIYRPEPTRRPTTREPPAEERRKAVRQKPPV